MPEREAEVANNTLLIREASRESLRVDGRGLSESRSLSFRFGPKDGLVEVLLGKQTRVLADVTAELVAPPPDRPQEGSVFLQCEIAHTSDNAFESGRSLPSSPAPELTRLLDKALFSSGAVDKEALCVKAGSYAWSVKCDVKVVDSCGGLFGACGIAAIAALASFRRPHTTVHHESGQLEVHSTETTEPVPLSIHHYPFVFEFAILASSDESETALEHQHSRILLDPSHEEETAAACHAIVAANSFEELCALHKPGEQAVPEHDMLRCTRTSIGCVKELTDRLKQELQARDKERVERRVRRRDPSKIGGSVPRAAAAINEMGNQQDVIAAEKEDVMVMPISDNVDDQQQQQQQQQSTEQSEANSRHKPSAGAISFGQKSSFEERGVEEAPSTSDEHMDDGSVNAGKELRSTANGRRDEPVVNSLSDALKSGNDARHRKGKKHTGR
jgi:exosome complex component RRP45